MRYYRQLRGLTTSKLAEKLNIVPATVLGYEQGRFPIPYDIAVLLAEELQISESLLFDDFCVFIYTILHSIFLSFDFYSEAKRLQPLFLSQSQSKAHKTRVTPPKRVIYPVKPSFHPSSNIKPTQSRIV